MIEHSSQSIHCVRSAEIASYLDGELSTQAQLQFEDHIKTCSSCAEEAREQRRLLCALDFALSADDPTVQLPRDFAKIVATNAESDMSGVRRRVEHGRALRVCIGLSLAAFFLLGGAALYSTVTVPIIAIARSSVSIGAFATNAVYDAGMGVAVILRALGRRLTFESHQIGLLAFILFAIAIALLPRLIIRYHRKQITE